MNIKALLGRIVIKWKIIKYNMLSTNKNISGNPIKNTPVLINGFGKVFFDNNVVLGYDKSPYFFNSYTYLEARNPNSKIHIMEGVYINNNAVIISEGDDGIFIGKNTLIGANFKIYDSDFHDLNPSKRQTGTPNSAKVIIGANVFIGADVIILKGVEIGENSVIGSGSVVSGSIPENVIAGGNPCRVIKQLNFNNGF